jgi:hypothetical protein
MWLYIPSGQSYVGVSCVLVGCEQWVIKKQSHYRPGQTPSVPED